MVGWFPADLLWNVSDCEVEGIGTLVSKVVNWVLSVEMIMGSIVAPGLSLSSAS